MSIFTKRGARTPAVAVIATAMASIGSLAAAGPKQLAFNPEDANAIITGKLNLEDANLAATGNFHTLSQSVNGIVGTFMGEAPATGVGKELWAHQTTATLEAANLAILATSGGMKASTGGFDSMATTHNGVEIVRPGGDGGYFTTEQRGAWLSSLQREGTLNMESFDNTPTRQVTEWATTYAMGSVRQNAFAQAFFTPIAISPMEPGLLASVRYRVIMNDIKRSIKGAAENWNRRPLVHALVDDTLLADDQTDLIPVYRDTGNNANTADFVAAGDVAVTNVLYEGVPVATNPLKFGRDINFMGLSQVDSLIEQGVFTQNDQLDTSIQMDYIYLKFGADVVKLNVADFTGSTLNFNFQNNSRSMVMNATFNLTINPLTKRADGTPLVSLASIVTGEFNVRFQVRISGEVNLDFGTGAFDCSAASIKATRIVHKDAPNTPIDLTTGAGLTMANLISTVTPLGYRVPNMRRINSNRRHSGQIIDTVEYRKYYAVPLRAPVTSRRAISDSDQTDADHIQTLVETTYARASGDAVKTLYRTLDSLKQVAVSGAQLDMNPEYMGMASRLVTPYVNDIELDLRLIVDSLTSDGRTMNISSAIMMALRDEMFKVGVQTNYFVALQSYYGGANVEPTILIGGGQRICAYIGVPGDTRLMANEMKHHIVASPNLRLKDQVFMTFVDYNAASQGKYNPMTFGHYLTKPEAVVNFQRSIGNQTVREMTAMPSYYNLVNLPILVRVTFVGLDDVLKKNPVFTHEMEAIDTAWAP